MNRIFVVLAALFLTVGCKNQIDRERISIIPLPVEIIPLKGNFQITQNTSINYDDVSLEFLASYASHLWEPYLGFALNKKLKTGNLSNHILLTINPAKDESIGEEGYTLNINKEGIALAANSHAGILYGIQTIYQLLGTNPNATLPSLYIKDYPRFQYRGMHLDVSRHFMPIEFIYQFIDHMVMHKFNTFHWHLVDDQGWRLEIMKYPKLTEVGAWRVDMSDRHWNDRPVSEAKSGPATYGGFYTQDEVRALVAYAAQRNITVMPEIEMPAHVMSALAAYPELSCTGKDLGVPPGGVWPITHIYCAGNEDTFTFLENVLTEVMELFPSKFIHIGGDEADKSEWKKCKRCQKRIKDEGLKNEHELQSYFIRRIEKFLNEHDRILVGWDEILEGGLAPKAVVMSWRGEEGGIEAARMGNKAIMTPGSHCYFDHYQGDPALEPLAIGGYTTLKKVYHYEPIPQELTADEGNLILGAQANVWTEYMPTTKQVEYMVFPRISALAEVLWSQKTSKDWGGFSHRMEHQYKRYDRLGLNYSRSAYQVKILPSLNPSEKKLTLELQTEVYQPEIRYTIDDSELTTSSPLYTHPIQVNKSTTLKSAIFKNGEILGAQQSSYYNLHKAFAAEIELKHPSSPKYNGQGKQTLVDGIEGSIYFNDGNWLGFSGNDLVATIDLGKPTKIESISVDALQNTASWIFLPQYATFEVSTDGNTFTTLETVRSSIPSSQGGKIIEKFKTLNTNQEARFVKVTLKNIGVCPKGHTGEGNAAWLFVSEIVID